MNYSNMPGPGNLPGCCPSANNPATPEPAYGRDDAAGNVADRLGRLGDVGELVETVADARPLLDWIAHNAELPAHLLAAFRALDRQARDLDKAVDAELAELNGGRP